MVTPAPLRQNPRLAPPSTLVAPSKFMPESSPAGPGLFWKGFLGGVTPGPPGSALPPDMSPVKGEIYPPARRNGAEDRDIMSSSPPPMDGGLGSPSKPYRGRSGTTTAPSVKLENYTEDPSSNASGNNPNNRLNGLGLGEGNGNSRFNQNYGNGAGLNFNRPALPNKDEQKDEEDDDDGGIDLAKGFAPIGSFSSQRSGGLRS